MSLGTLGEEDLAGLGRLAGGYKVEARPDGGSRMDGLVVVCVCVGGGGGQGGGGRGGRGTDAGREALRKDTKAKPGHQQHTQPLARA